MNENAAVRAAEALDDGAPDVTPTPDGGLCPFGLRVGEAIQGQPRGGRVHGAAVMDDMTEEETRRLILGDYIVLDDGSRTPDPEGFEPVPVGQGRDVVPFRL